MLLDPLRHLRRDERYGLRSHAHQRRRRAALRHVPVILQGPFHHLPQLRHGLRARGADYAHRLRRVALHEAILVAERGQQGRGRVLRHGSEESERGDGLPTQVLVAVLQLFDYEWDGRGGRGAELPDDVERLGAHILILHPQSFDDDTTAGPILPSAMVAEV